jgi:hypothetical protein
VAFDPFILQDAIDPEAVEASLLDDDESGSFSPSALNAFSRSCAKRSSSPAISPPRTECFDIFSPPPGDSDVISQVDRLSSNETKIAPRSVRIAVGASGRSATICMVVSRVGGFSNLTLPECRSLSTPHGIFVRDCANAGWIHYMLKHRQKSEFDGLLDCVMIESLHNPIADA